MSSAYSGIHEIVIKASGSSYDYQELIADLTAVNMPLANTFNNSLYNPVDMSYAAANRTDKTRASIPKTYKKNSIYGVVVAAIENPGIFGKLFSGYTYYVDVPPFNKKIISHPDNFLTDSANLEQFEDLIFEYQGFDFLSGIEKGCIVKVEIPENYPNHILTNKSDAVITEVLIKKNCVKPNENAKKIENSSQGGLGGTNGSPNLRYGDANIEYTWALTKTGKAPAALAATEKISIDAAKKEFDYIIKANLLSEYDSMFNKICKEIGINPIFVKSIAAIESKFNPKAISGTGAAGLMQLTGDPILELKGGKKNGRTIIGDKKAYEQFKKRFNIKNDSDFKPRQRLGVKNRANDPYNIEQNVWIGAWYLNKTIKGKPNILGGIGAYNNGTGVVRGQSNSGVLKNPLDFKQITDESTIYIFKFNAMAHFMAEHYKIPAPPIV